MLGDLKIFRKYYMHPFIVLFIVINQNKISSRVLCFLWIPLSHTDPAPDRHTICSVKPRGETHVDFSS